MKEIRPRLSEEEWSIIQRHRKPEGVLVIPDLHAPFLKPGFLDHCLKTKRKYNTKKVIFIGDIVDNHYSSYHETDPDGHSAGEELARAIEMIREWYYHFPKAKVCIGNHDSIPARKAMTAGLSKRWLKSIADVIETPGWDFQMQHIIDDVKYIHGTGQKARSRAKNDLISIVQGHYHSESYIEWYVGPDRKIFAMQLGAGIDRRAYAMAYGRIFKKPHINCGIIIDGELPIIEYMRLT